MKTKKLLPARRKPNAAVPSEPLAGVNPKLELIQLLIPIALECVQEVLQQEVEQLAGPRYSHDDAQGEYKRWGQQRGSVYLGDQKVPIQVPRVRNVQRRQEIPLTNYHHLQRPVTLEDQLFVRIIRGLSCRQYERASRLVPQAFGLSRNQISRRFIRQSAQNLQTLLQRRLEAYTFAALVLDGKTFGEAQMIIALGITISGEKVVLGFVESGTENGRVCAEFLQTLVAQSGDLSTNKRRIVDQQI